MVFRELQIRQDPRRPSRIFSSFPLLTLGDTAYAVVGSSPPHPTSAVARLRGVVDSLDFRRQLCCFAALLSFAPGIEELSRLLHRTAECESAVRNLTADPELLETLQAVDSSAGKAAK